MWSIDTELEPELKYTINKHHLNDSKKDCGCKVDRHENLCLGCIGKDDDSGFRYFVNHCFNLKIPLILETPHDDNNMYEIYAQDLEKVNNWLKS